MKKKLIVIVGIIILNSSLFILHSHAQVQFGVRAGANLVNMKMSDGVQNLSGNNRSGFYVGPTIKFGLPVTGLGIDASAVYDQRTSDVTYNIDEQGNTASERVTARAISIPINVRYGINVSIVELFAFAGPQFGFNLSKSKYLGANEWTWRSSNLSVNVGVGFCVLDKVEVKANYNVACGKTGEVNVWNATKTTVQQTFKSKYNSWQVGVAYYF
jgi:hypothetical protein